MDILSHECVARAFRRADFQTWCSASTESFEMRVLWLPWHIDNNVFLQHSTGTMLMDFTLISVHWHLKDSDCGAFFRAFSFHLLVVLAKLKIHLGLEIW